MIFNLSNLFLYIQHINNDNIYYISKGYCPDQSVHPVTLVSGVGLTDSVSLLLMLCSPWVWPPSVTTPCVSTIDGIPWAAFYFFKKLINFFERERAHARECVGGGAEGEGERESQGDSLLSAEPKGARAHDHVMVTWAEANSQLLSQLNCPGTPAVLFIPGN